MMDKFKYGYLADGGTGWSGGASGGVGLPQVGEIIFQQNFYDGSATPQIGSATYTRSGSLTYNSSSSVISEVAADTMPIGPRWNGTETLKGAYFAGAIVNYLLYSEDFTHAEWTAIGTGAAVANTATDPMGGSNADTISGSATGAGITQTIATVGGSIPWVFSVWLKTSTGTATVDIALADAGTQGSFTRCDVTTSWRRFQVPYNFVASAANVAVNIIVGNTSTVRAFGAQLEQWTGTGRRIRRAMANNYVRTTTGSATAGNSSHLIPNSIVSQIATKGSIAFWTLVDWDFIDTDPNQPPYAFSVSGETFALSFASWYGAILWINGNIAANCPGSSGLDRSTYGLSADRWTHVCVTFDTATDSYKIYFNAFDSTAETNAQSTIAISTNTMNLGGYDTPNSTLGIDGYMSQFIMWKVVLTPSEVAQVYQTKAGVAIRSDPGVGQLWSVDLGTSPIPTVGDTEYYWNAKGLNGWLYPTTTTTLVAADCRSSFPAPCYPLNGFNKGGFGFVSQNTNYILQSEAIGTTWTAAGAVPTITAGVGTFLGVVTYGTVLGVSGDGIQQSVATATASTEWTASFYGSVAAGTLSCRLTLEGDSGGTPGTVNQDITLTTTPQRFSVYGSFGSSNTGNIRLKFTLLAAGTARVGGFMLERCNIGAGSAYWKVGANYIKTTTAAVTNQWNQLVYRMTDSWNIKKGTAIAWGFLWDADVDNDFITANGPTPIGGPGQFANFYWHIQNADEQTLDYGGKSPAVTTPNINLTRNQWHQFAITWDTTVTPNTFSVYLDGALRQTTTQTDNRVLTHRKIIVGGDFVYASMDFFQGALDHMEIWGAPNATAISDDWTARRASYGR